MGQINYGRIGGGRRSSLLNARWCPRAVVETDTTSFCETLWPIGIAFEALASDTSFQMEPTATVNSLEDQARIFCRMRAEGLARAARLKSESFAETPLASAPPNDIGDVILDSFGQFPFTVLMCGRQRPCGISVCQSGLRFEFPPGDRLPQTTVHFWKVKSLIYGAPQRRRGLPPKISLSLVGSLNSSYPSSVVIFSVVSGNEERVASFLEAAQSAAESAIVSEPTTVFISGLDGLTPASDVESIYSRFGPIASCEVQPSTLTSYCATVEFESAAGALNTVKRHHRVRINERRVVADISIPPSGLETEEGSFGVWKYFPQAQRISGESAISIRGSVSNNTIDLFFSESALCNIWESPGVILNLYDVEIAYFERALLTTKTFDAVFVLRSLWASPEHSRAKDYAKYLFRIDAVARGDLEVLMVQLTQRDIKYYCGGRPLRWEFVLKTVREQADIFWDGPGWAFLSPADEPGPDTDPADTVAPDDFGSSDGEWTP